MASSLQGQKKRKRDSTSESTILTDEEDTGFLCSRQKALQNDLILGNISGFLPLTELKECRLVNRQWKGACQASCVKKCPGIGFGMESHYGHVTHGIEKMRDLIELINRSGDAFPCKRFAVKCGIGDVNNPEEETILVNFFRAIAPVAEALWIGEMDARLFKRNPQNLQFSGLKSLKLNETHYLYPEKAHGNNLKFCRNIIQNSTQLAKLEISFTYSETARELITALETAPGHNIINLHLSGPLNDTLFNLMTGIGLKLRSLSLNIDKNSIVSEDGESLRNFLCSQKNSLEVLDLDVRKKTLIISFPVMKALTQIELSTWPTSEIEFSRISYAQQFPVLQSLSIEYLPERDLDSLFDFRIAPVNTVTSLKLPSLDLKNPTLIWQAARIFPNVRKLKVPGRERIVRSAYEAWQKLEDLTIQWVGGGDGVDKVLTTYARSSHGLSQRPLNEKEFQPVEFPHNLMFLRLDDFGITDQVCRLVLLKLPSLRRLELSEWSAEKISEEVFQEMRDKFIVILLTEDE